jgi:PKD repeat protein
LNNSTNATSYEWNFGDGSTSTLSNPSHTYVDGGNYTVTLTAFNGDCSDVYTFELSGVSVTENTATSSVSVFPNPSNGLLNLNIMSINNGVVLTNIYDVTGKLVYNQTLSVSQGSQVISLDLEYLQNGLYFLTIDENEGSKSTVKFTVQH